MMKSSGKVYAIIPARGGSKSIPMKNMIPLCGVPLIDWVIQAGKKSSQIDKLLCTTDNDDIKKYCEEQGVECVPRPSELATDSAKVQDAAKNLLEVLEEVDERPEFVVLLQPTSPFIRSDHIAGCIRLLRSRTDANSSQTIAKVPHNFHAYNQRVKEKGIVSFKFASEREKYFNKQKKPNLYKFGNVVVARSKTLLEGGSFFAQPSLGLEIPEIYSFDLDQKNDLGWGEYCLANRLVELD
ncbi:acylneuraminate cytidylyltransferase family protein [Gammaproteobacteria bacterium]|nr:acylneuraminate cytidylyltransferase family protein [Gammaproteobacteria bacterium]